MPDLRQKALAYLRSGAVRVLNAETRQYRPCTVEAHVKGYNETYIVRLTLLDGWRCSCPRKTGCAHIAAVQLITGHDSAAARDRR